jgi:hypothetical protein
MKVGDCGQWDRIEVCNEKEVAKGEGEKLEVGDPRNKISQSNHNCLVKSIMGKKLCSIKLLQFALQFSSQGFTCLLLV